MSELPYLYRWDRQGRKGQPCRVTARGTMNSIRVEFADGFAMVTSGNAIRRAVREAPPSALPSISPSGGEIMPSREATP